MVHARTASTSLMLALVLTAFTAFSQDVTQSIADERAEADRTAEATLDQLFEEQPDAKRLYEQAYGYAVFTNYKFAAGIVAGGGSGVAINKQTDERIYMEMGTAGIAAGLGGQKYQLVMLFETGETFNDFITDGWEATASANAVAGEAGANAATSFKDGVLIYPLTDAGLMLNADISGTRFWIDEDLNDQAVRSDDQFFDNESQQDEALESGDAEHLDNEDVLEHERQLETEDPIEEMPQ